VKNAMEIALIIINAIVMELALLYFANWEKINAFVGHNRKMFNVLI